jgi:hypothetical protein
MVLKSFLLYLFRHRISIVNMYYDSSLSPAYRISHKANAYIPLCCFAEIHDGRVFLEKQSGHLSLQSSLGDTAVMSAIRLCLQ